MSNPNPNPDEDEIIEEQQEQGGTGSPAETPPKPTDQNEEQEELEISRDPVEEQEQEEEQPPVSRRESKRIQQLLDKMASFDESRATGRTQQPQRRGGGRQVIPEGEYDIEEINEMARQYGASAYEQGLSTAQAMSIATNFATRLEIDAPQVNSKYPFLDKTSDDFNPGVASIFNRMYLNEVGYDRNTGTVLNQNLRYGEFVEGLMEVIEMISAGKVADNTKNLAEQAARTGIRPGGSRKPVYRGTNPKQMTDEQLDAAIAAALGT